MEQFFFFFVDQNIFIRQATEYTGLNVVVKIKVKMEELALTKIKRLTHFKVFILWGLLHLLYQDAQ